MKYTKTCDVIQNLLIRWRKLIDKVLDHILIHAKKKKKIKSIPTNPLGKIEIIKKLFKKDKDFLEVIKMYEMFRKIRELRIDFSKNRHRIFYFTFIKKTIILLHIFIKKTQKTPVKEIKKAEKNLNNVINNRELYE